MTDHTSGHDGNIETEAEFEAAIQEVLHAAAENGIDPRGTWVYRNDGTHPDWEVMVLELTKDGASD